MSHYLLLDPDYHHLLFFSEYNASLSATLISLYFHYYEPWEPLLSLYLAFNLSAIALSAFSDWRLPGHAFSGNVCETKLVCLHGYWSGIVERC